MTHRRKWLLLFAVFLIMIGAMVTTFPRIMEFYAVNSCLDSGGSYDYIRGICDYQQNHTYIPWSERSRSKSLSLAGKILVLAGFITLALGEWGRQRKSRCPTVNGNHPTAT